MLVKYIKKYKIFIIIFIFSLLLMFLMTLYQTHVFYIVKQFIFNSEYRDNFVANSDIPINFDLNLFNIIKFVLGNFQWTYDYMLIWGTNIFQLLIPIFASICALIFYNQNQTINNFIINKKKTYKSFLFKESFILSLKMATSIFLAFIIFYIFCIVFSKGVSSPNIFREFLLDIIGNDFYYKHTKMYYLLDGMIRMFLVPLIYSMFACSISLFLKSYKHVFLFPIVYYFGLTLFSFAISYIVDFGIYISPLIVMVHGDYANINSLYIMIMPLFAVLVSISLIFWRSKYVEI